MFRNYRSFLPTCEKKLPVLSGDSSPLYQLEVSRLFDNFSRLFDNFSRTLPTNATSSLAENLLRLDVCENDKEIVVSADVPGMTQKDITVTLSNKILTISGSKEIERDEKKNDYHLIERSFGSFTRSLELPVEIDADKIEAKCSQGVLSIHLPKSERAQTSVKKIEVRS